MVLNEFDAYVEALKKIDLNEEVAPVYKGHLLTENVDIYCKIQKILGCPAMEQCHRYLYDLDVENLDESECSKVNNLFKLGVEKGYLEDENEEKTDECDILPPEADCQIDQALQISTNKDPAPAIPQKPMMPEAPMAAFTVLYSATRDGNIKTGEAYSNSLNTRSAKADVMNQLEKAGYQNIKILAIEAGDPDMQGCDNTFVKQPELPAYEDGEDVVEADDREPLSHALDTVGVRASTANSIGQDAVKVTLTEDETKAEMKKAFDNVNKTVGDTISPNDVKSMLYDRKKDIEAARKIIEKTCDKNVVANYNKIVSFLDNYASGNISEDEELNEANKNTTSILVRGLVKIVLYILTTIALCANGLTTAILMLSGIINAGAKKIDKITGDIANKAFNGYRKYRVLDSEDEDQVNEDGEDEEKSDDSEEDDSSEGDESKEDDEKEDSSDEKDDKSADDDEEDKEDDKKEEDAEEPDEKLKDDKKEEEGKEDATDDKDEEELSAQDKSQLKDSYKKAFKAAMQKCKYFDKCFDDLTLEEKVKFFETIDDAWGNKADPSKFMSDKETEQLQKIVVKK